MNPSKSNPKNVTQVLFTRHFNPANLFSKGQFWGRAALAPVDLSQDPGALFCAKYGRVFWRLPTIEMRFAS